MIYHMSTLHFLLRREKEYKPRQAMTLNIVELAEPNCPKSIPKIMNNTLA